MGIPQPRPAPQRPPACITTTPGTPTVTVTQTPRRDEWTIDPNGVMSGTELWADDRANVRAPDNAELGRLIAAMRSAGVRPQIARFCAQCGYRLDGGKCHACGWDVQEHDGKATDWLNTAILSFTVAAIGGFATFIFWMLLK